MIRACAVWLEGCCDATGKALCTDTFFQASHPAPKLFPKTPGIEVCPSSQPNAESHLGNVVVATAQSPGN